MEIVGGDWKLKEEIRKYKLRLNSKGRDWKVCSGDWKVKEEIGKYSN